MIKVSKVITPRVPGNATIWFVAAKDKNGLFTTTAIQFRDDNY